jgi:hypothetical protein
MSAFTILYIFRFNSHHQAKNCTVQYIIQYNIIIQYNNNNILYNFLPVDEFLGLKMLQTVKTDIVSITKW